MKIKLLREQIGKTQAQVAVDLNITRTKFARYEMGESSPKVETLIKLADYFDVSLDYLCGRQYNNKIGYIPDDKKELVKTLLELNNEDCSKLQGYMSALLDKK